MRASCADFIFRVSRDGLNIQESASRIKKQPAAEQIAVNRKAPLVKMKVSILRNIR